MKVTTKSLELTVKVQSFYKSNKAKDTYNIRVITSAGKHPITGVEQKTVRDYMVTTSDKFLKLAQFVNKDVVITLDYAEKAKLHYVSSIKLVK